MYSVFMQEDFAEDLCVVKHFYTPIIASYILISTADSWSSRINIPSSNDSNVTISIKKHKRNCIMYRY